MKKIPLTQGLFALVDDGDYESLQKFKWCALRRGRSIHAMTNIRRADGKQANLYMHRFLLPNSEQVDHKNGDGLDNRRENLRAATCQENRWGFRQLKVGASSKFRGVSWDNDRDKWRARIAISGKQIHLGLFPDEKDAAEAYDDAARKFFGEFASPNFSK